MIKFIIALFWLMNRKINFSNYYCNSYWDDSFLGNNQIIFPYVFCVSSLRFSAEVQGNFVLHAAIFNKRRSSI